jgi:hypothetical protein
MAPQKNAKYVVTTYKSNPRLPAYRRKMDPRFVKKVTNVDAETVPGAEFYSETMWILPGDESKKGIVETDSHTHTWGELIGFFGLNYDDIQDLGAEIEFTVDNEKHVITRSFASFVPAGVQHGPLIIRNVKRPIFHFMSGPTKKYE